MSLPGVSEDAPQSPRSPFRGSSEGHIEQVSLELVFLHTWMVVIAMSLLSPSTLLPRTAGRISASTWLDGLTCDLLHFRAAPKSARINQSHETPRLPFQSVFCLTLLMLFGSLASSHTDTDQMHPQPSPRSSATGGTTSAISHESPDPWFRQIPVSQQYHILDVLSPGFHGHR